MKKFAQFVAAAAIPVLSIVALAGSASAAGTIVIKPINPIPATGALAAVVSGSGWTPSSQLFMSQCVDAARQAAGSTFNPQTDCEANTATAVVDPAFGGAFSDNFDIIAGIVSPTTSGGQGFLCDATHPCRLRVSEGTFLSTASQSFTPLTFSAPVVVTTTTVAPTTTTVAATTTTLAATTTTVGGPTPVVPESPLPILLPVGAAVVLGAGYMMLRKGRNSSLNA